MDWRQLLEARRLGNFSTLVKGISRSDYQRDFDRIIFSTSFRRMHGKTQVFPLPESDITHTRLTHSLEVSCVGRSLGSMVGRQLRHIESESESLAAIVAAAALAHDLGNPPFGHSGEAAIAEFFLGIEGLKFLQGLTPSQQADFQNFEGNALGFRLLTRTKPRLSSWPGGLQLTLATLGAYSKYPRPSLPLGRDGHASEKKFGFFQSEAPIFDDVAKQLGLVPSSHSGWCRHPLAFLVEAADDICYRIIDLEDGFRLNLVPYERAEQLLGDIAGLGPFPMSADTFSGIRDPNERIGYLRAKAINNLVSQAAQTFVDHHKALLDGIYDSPLLNDTPGFEAIEAIKAATKKLIYPHRPVVEIETAGFRVLGGLLEDLLTASWEHPRSKRSEKVLSLIGNEYLVPNADDPYEALMGIVEFVASMTDNFAIGYYRVLRGMELPRT